MASWLDEVYFNEMKTQQYHEWQSIGFAIVGSLFDPVIHQLR